MRINDKGLALIKHFEGFSSTAYKDPVGIVTIGYGSTGRDIEPGMVWTKEQAEERLLRDLETAENYVSAKTQIPLSSNQFSALVSLVYNIGTGAYGASTLLKRLNEVKLQEAADEFLRWNKAGKSVLTGLTRRREAERELFLS